MTEQSKSQIGTKGAKQALLEVIPQRICITFRRASCWSRHQNSKRRLWDCWAEITSPLPVALKVQGPLGGLPPPFFLLPRSKVLAVSAAAVFFRDLGRRFCGSSRSHILWSEEVARSMGQCYCVWFSLDWLPRSMWSKLSPLSLKLCNELAGPPVYLWFIQSPSAKW